MGSIMDGMMGGGGSLFNMKGGMAGGAGGASGGAAGMRNTGGVSTGAPPGTTQTSANEFG